MALFINFGRRKFTAEQYKKFREEKPLTLRDLCATETFKLSNTLNRTKGRKAASFRSLSLSRARFYTSARPPTQSLLSMKHLCNSVAEVEAIHAAFAAYVKRMPKIKIKGLYSTPPVKGYKEFVFQAGNVSMEGKHYFVSATQAAGLDQDDVKSIGYIECSK